MLTRCLQVRTDAVARRNDGWLLGAAEWMYDDGYCCHGLRWGCYLAVDLGMEMRMDSPNFAVVVSLLYCWITDRMGGEMQLQIWKGYHRPLCWLAGEDDDAVKSLARRWQLLCPELKRMGLHIAAAAIVGRICRGQRRGRR
ncbi:hypothetical protein ACLOJK_007066 [Asimina triloba]